MYNKNLPFKTLDQFCVRKYSGEWGNTESSAGCRTSWAIRGYVSQTID